MTESTSRTFLQRADLQRVSDCTLRGIGVPTDAPAFNQTIQKIAQDNDYNVVDRGHDFVCYYQGNEFDPIKTVSKGAFTFYNSLLFDVDPKRRANIANFVQQQGCGDAIVDAACAHAILMLPEFLQMGMTSALPQCTDLPHHAVCTFNLFIQISKQLEEFENDMTAFRQQHKTVTYTDQWRADHLYKLISIEAAKPSSVFKSPPRRVLIVGPGLERLNKLGTSVPQRTYEPFAVAKACTTILGATPTQLRIDILDINPDVIDHMKEVSVREKEYHFNPQLGNIITDKVADDNSYDMVVIKNTFMYFTNWELVLAMENIERLLKPGGVLITDMGPGAVESDVTYPVQCPQSPAEKMQRQNISHKWIPLTFTYTKTQ